MIGGIYIHIPFCKSRCSYCDFATDVYKDNQRVERYVDALISEITRFECATLQNLDKIDTIYFGGGTPSLLTPAQLERIISAIHGTFSVPGSAEFTLEMNPATVSLNDLKAFRSLGVNRASFGVQTFNDRALKILARGHSANDARKTFELLRRAKFENISFDLIGGLPSQTLDDWGRNLSEALAMQPEHLSLYLLEIHKGTPLAEQIRAKRQPMPDENLAGEMYRFMVEKVAASALRQYEISNFSIPGFESNHNKKYWLCEPVLGFGVSAHSFDGKASRWSNERDTDLYISRIEDGKTPVTENNELTLEQLSSEVAFLSLRLNKGLNLREYELRFGIDLKAKFGEELERFEELEMVEFENGFLKLTQKGFVFSNEVFSIFV